MGNGKIAAVSKNVGGRPKGFSASETDLYIIGKVAREGFQTYQELHTGKLKDWPKSSLWRRLKRLVQEGCLQKGKDDKGRALGWSINHRDISKHFKLPEQVSEDAKRAPVYKTAYTHDLTLRLIKAVLGESSAVVRWVPEHVLKTEVMREFHYLHPRDKRDKLIAVPDALLHLRSGGEASKAALELELTRKSKRRLYQKFENYVTSEEFDYAFFIAKDENLKHVLTDVYDEVIAQSMKVKITKQPNGIYFATLAAIQKQGLHAKFVSRHDSLSFAELGD